MAQKLQDLSSTIADLTLLQAADLIKILEEKLGVSAVPPQMMMASSSSVASSEEVDEKTVFDVDTSQCRS